MSRLRSWLATLALVVLAGVPAFAREVPYLSGRVNDTADMLTAEAKQRLEAELAELEQKTGAQVAVLTIDTLDGDPLEDYSLRVAETWKLGRGKFDDGALMLIVRDDRKMRIEVGYGLEGTLPDAIASRILNQIVRPAFRAGDFSHGIEAGVDRIVGTLEGTLPPLEEEPQQASGGRRKGEGMAGFMAFLGFLGWVVGAGALRTKGRGAWILYPFLFIPWVGVPYAFLGSSFGIAGAVAWGLGFPLLHGWLHHTVMGQRTLKNWQTGATRSGRGGGSWSSGGGGGWSGGGGGGGFSGGGGSFGGGGASSSW